MTGPGRPEKGTPWTLGAAWHGEGVNFALHSGSAERVELCLFDADGATETARIAVEGRTGSVWHVYLPGVAPGQRYGYRVHGPYDPSRGLRFNPAKLLLDPYATAWDRPFRWADPALRHQIGEIGAEPVLDRRDNAASMVKAMVTAPDAFDWGDDRPPGTPLADTVIYELHVKGFTQLHPEMPEPLRGTFLGVAERAPIDHLRRLGITAVELMPVMAFIDEPIARARGLTNYWGYNTLGFFVPDSRYGGGRELKTLVRRLHEAGIEVILDVVFNHTGEGDHAGPILSFRGIDNPGYYRLRPGDPGCYDNPTGTGNALDFDRPAVQQLVMDSLRWWATEYRIDGFRFDLATVLARREGTFDPHAPLLAAIGQDPLLRRLKLIAEPWDVGPGGWQVGAFPPGWSEWNDRSRDDLRRFFLTRDIGPAGLADRLAGSSALFRHDERAPQASINFVAAHDGFTLADLVTFEAKRNEANGEENHDGSGENLGWNAGIEGVTSDPAVLARRRALKRALLAALLVCRGVPMLSMGDELGRSQHGNNNAWCQDNPTSWLDWSTGDAELAGFVTRLIRLRQEHAALRGLDWLDDADVEWLAPEGGILPSSRWHDPSSRLLGLHYKTAGLLILVNGGLDSAGFALPPGKWRALLDTADTEAATLAPSSLRVLARDEDAMLLDVVSKRIGLAAGYWGVDGQWHEPPDRAAILKGLGWPAEDPALLRAALARLDEEPWHQALPPVCVVAEGVASVQTVVLPFGRVAPWRLESETGETISGSAGGVKEEASATIGGVVLQRHAIALPGLPAGYHRLVLPGEGVAMTVIAVPETCSLPPVLAQRGRVWGVSVQLYSVRSRRNWGIGDYTDLARLAVLAGQQGADLIGVNPLHARSLLRPQDCSPYSPVSRMALDTLAIDVEAVPELAWSSSERASIAAPAFQDILARLRALDWVDYEQVTAVKLPVLRRLHEVFLIKADPARRRDYDSFLDSAGEGVRRYARFEALRACHGPALAWWEWPDDQAADDPAIVREEKFQLWLQFVADEQLAQASQAAREAGMRIGIYSDLAVSAAADGADCWGAGELMAHLTVGAPPDPMNWAGQNWQLPVPDPRALERAAFEPFVAVLRASMRHAGALRIDHAMALARLFVIPPGGSGADGSYLAYPFTALAGILALESQRAKCLVIGEDLGTVPEGFHEAMAAREVLSYKVLPFERHPDGVLRAPADYPFLALATASTHDLTPLAGTWLGTDIGLRSRLGLDADEAAAQRERIVERRRLLALLDGQRTMPSPRPDPENPGPDAGSIVAAEHRLIAGSGAAIAMIQLVDIFGETRPVNLPGVATDYPNWRLKLPLDMENAAFMRSFADAAGLMTAARPR